MSKTADILWRFDEIGQITQNPEIIRVSFRRLGVSEVLVREVIQNSLDARILGKDLKMLFSFNDVEKDSVQKYFESLLPHLEAERYPRGGKVIPDETITIIKSTPIIKILCIEDLNTTGLDGDISSLGNKDSGSNFGAFWRGEGISSKHGTKGGRWGQGKTTFNMASKVSSFWGLTRRHSDSLQLLMGKALLHPHVMNGERYVYHGLYTAKNSAPISDAAFLREFKHKMQCMRNDNESGLSLIIPYPLDEVTLESIVKAAIMHYFFPIIKKDLTIKIRNLDGSIQDIDSTTIIDIAESLEWGKTFWEKSNKDDILKVLQFSKECVELLSNGDMIKLPDSVATSLKITDETLQDTSNIGDLMISFNRGQPLGFIIPVNIITKDGNESQTHFEIFIKKYLNEGMTRSDEHYIRSGISLPEEERRLGGRPVRGILYAEDKIISEFLGDAEEPAHTHWNERREGFGEKYNLHRDTLRFIRNAMRDIVEALDMQSRERDYNLLEHIFAIPDPEKQDEEQREIKDTESAPEDPIPPSEGEFVIEKITNGFVIKYNGKRYEYPVSARLRIAYDVQRGNPFSSYEPYDFDLRDGSITIDVERCDISRMESNVIFFVLQHWKSSIKLIGFDPNRDIICHVTKVNQ